MGLGLGLGLGYVRHLVARLHAVGALLVRVRVKVRVRVRVRVHAVGALLEV